MYKLLDENAVMKDSDIVIHTDGTEIRVSLMAGIKVCELLDWVNCPERDTPIHGHGWAVAVLRSTTVNHWGHWVDSEVPITGVYSIHSIALEWLDGGSICLDCEEYIRQQDGYLSETDDDDEEFSEDYLYEVECDSSHTKLIGDWKLVDGKYEPDKDKEFAAIERETVVQVVWSTFTARAALCSPCYPGQADADSVGEFLHYAMPPELLRKDDE